MQTPDARLSALLRSPCSPRPAAPALPRTSAARARRSSPAATSTTSAPSRTPARAWTAQGGGTGDGTQIQEWPCNGTGSQSYELKDVRQRRLRDRQHAGQQVRRATCRAPARANGTPVQLWDCNGTGAQSFVTEDAGNGFVHLVNTNSNKCLDVAGDNPANGTLVQLYDCNGTNENVEPVRSSASASGSGGSGSSSGGGSGEKQARGTPPGWTRSPGPTSSTVPTASGVDQSKWSFDTGGSGWGNNEARGTTRAAPRTRSSPAATSSSPPRPPARPPTRAGTAPVQYTSARLHYRRQVLASSTARFEARISDPRRAGRVARRSWMLGNDIGSAGWPSCGRIDVMNIGRTPDKHLRHDARPGTWQLPWKRTSGAFNSSAADGQRRFTSTPPSGAPAR